MYAYLYCSPTKYGFPFSELSAPSPLFYPDNSTYRWPTTPSRHLIHKFPSLCLLPCQVVMSISLSPPQRRRSWHYFTFTASRAARRDQWVANVAKHPACESCGSLVLFARTPFYALFTMSPSFGDFGFASIIYLPSITITGYIYRAEEGNEGQAERHSLWILFRKQLFCPFIIPRPV